METEKRNSIAENDIKQILGKMYELDFAEPILEEVGIFHIMVYTPLES